MDNSEIVFQREMFSCGMELEVLEWLPFKPVHVVPFNDDGYLLELSDKKYCLWIFRGGDNLLDKQMQLFQLCQQQGLKGLLYPIKLCDGQNYAKYDEQKLFYITPWPKLGKVYFSCIGHLKLIVNLIAEFRRVLNESDFSVDFSEWQRFNLIEKFKDVINQVHAFELLAEFRISPTLFDRLFLSYSAEIIHQADQAICVLEKSNYLHMVNKLSLNDIIINELTRHNLRINTDKAGVCLSLENWRWDLPIMDLAILLLKSGRSNYWDLNWFLTLVKQYQSCWKISEDEYQIILAYLTFPWNLYRLIARYYYNRTKWPLRTFIEKIQRLLGDELKRKELLKRIK